MGNNLWNYLSPYATATESQLVEGGGPFPNDRFWNCVFACVSVALQAYKYPDVEPEDLRQLVQPGSHAGADFDRVANYLRAHPERWPNLPRIDTWNPADTLGTFADMLNKGYVTIFDVYDDGAGNILDHPSAGGFTHAVMLEAMGPTKITVWNPWNGEQAGQTFDRAYIKRATSGVGGAATTMVGNLMVFARSVIPAPAPVVVPTPAPKPVPVPTPTPVVPPIVPPPVVTPPVVVPVVPDVPPAPPAGFWQWLKDLIAWLLGKK